DASKPAPLVVMLHGCTQDPEDFARGSRFNQAAADSGVIVAYPEQTSAQQVQKCWTWYDPAHQGRGGEPAIIAAITREVMAKHAVDPARVYVGGVSAGGAMAVNVAASYPELYAAAGAHSGTAYRAAGNVMQALQVMKQGPAGIQPSVAALRSAMGEGARVPPLIVFHGKADAVVGVANGEILAEQWAGALGHTEGAAYAPPLDPYAVTRTLWGNDVESWIVADLGHAWSGGSPEGTFTDPRGPDATREMLRFFLAHRKP
ncbi:MAG TPA: PHB depolymerase family esterase, partial [Longimicrobium sp.]|nr:PHB depolymerase family esterase [Longimicrobium sp.]